MYKNILRYCCYYYIYIFKMGEEFYTFLWVFWLTNEEQDKVEDVWTYKYIHRLNFMWACVCAFYFINCFWWLKFYGILIGMTKFFRLPLFPFAKRLIIVQKLLMVSACWLVLLLLLLVFNVYICLCLYKRVYFYGSI